MKAGAETLAVLCSNLQNGLNGNAKPRRNYPKAQDAAVLHVSESGWRCLRPMAAGAVLKLLGSWIEDNNENPATQGGSGIHLASS